MSQPPPSFPPPPGFPPPGPPPGQGSSRTLLWVSVVSVVAVLAVAAVLVVVLVTRDGDDDDRDAREDRSDSSTETSSDASSDASDASDGPTEASDVVDPSSTTSSATPVDVTSAELDGQWYGRYRCAQGASAGRLRITAVEGSTSELTAVFRFGASTNNAGTPPGAYRLEGEVVNGIMSLRATEWIEQPPGYIYVDMVGVITEEVPTVIEGEVSAAGCSKFHFERK